MEELWVQFAREYPIGHHETPTQYLKRFYDWCAGANESMRRVAQLEAAVQAAHALLLNRKLIKESGYPTEYATRSEREQIALVGRAVRGEEA